MRDVEKKAPPTAARRGGDIQDDNDAEPERLIAWLGKRLLQEKLADAVADLAATQRAVILKNSAERQQGRAPHGAAER